MKKALQITHLRALESISKRPVVRGLFGAPREARRRRPGDERTELVVGDLGGPAGRLLDLFTGSRRGASRRRLESFGARLRQRSRHERERRRTRQPGADLAGAVAELEAPDRVARVDDQRAVALEASRPGIARDLLADCRRPRGDDLAHAGVRPEPAELALHVAAQLLEVTPFDRAPPRARPRAAGR